MLEKLRVERAIEALTDPEWLKLRRFADFRVLRLGRFARGMTGEDLLSEALLSTLSRVGAKGVGRRWSRRVDFFRHLAEAMRSICNHRRRNGFERATYLASEVVTCNAEGQERSPLENVASGDAATDVSLIARQEVDRLLVMFQKDSEAIAVLRGLLSGMRKKEVMQNHGLAEESYKAAMKRIRSRFFSRQNERPGGNAHGV